MNEVLNKVCNVLYDILIETLVTVPVVYYAKKKFYYSKNKSTIEKFMRTGLMELLGRKKFPPNAKAILVENKGFTIIRGAKYKAEYPWSRLRKTVTTVGGNQNSTSETRALYWGVLGLAYKKKTILVYDFRAHRLMSYKTDLKTCEVEKRGDGYYYSGDKSEKIEPHKLQEPDSDRSIMIAIPLCKGKKIVGGLTFDIDRDISEKTDGTNRTRYSFQGDKEELIKKCQDLNDTGLDIVTAYFCKP